MNINITSKEAILTVCRDIIKKDGWKELNIRNVALKCNISIGTVYNYFDNKNKLVSETVKSIWGDIFIFESKKQITFTSFKECIKWMYNSMEKGNEEYPQFMSIHSLSFMGEEKIVGLEMMREFWEKIKTAFLSVLNSDPNVDDNKFDDTFTKVSFINTIFTLMLASFMQGDFNSTTVLALIDRLIY